MHHHQLLSSTRSVTQLLGTTGTGQMLFLSHNQQCRSTKRNSLTKPVKSPNGLMGVSPFTLAPNTDVTDEEKNQQ